MKKISHIVLSILMVTFMLAACTSGNGSSGKKVITLWSSGSDNIKKTYEKLTTAFNESSYGAEYELKVEFILSGTGAQTLVDRISAATKAKEKDTDFDIIELGADEYPAYAKLAGSEVFEKLDFTKIPNSKNLTAKVANGEAYLLPFRGTTVVLAYNSEKVSNPPKTANELYEWIKKNPGKFAYNTPGTGGAGASFVTTAIYNNLPTEAATSDDEKWKNEWNKGFDFLEELHPYLYKSGDKVVYPNKNQGTLDLLANGEVDMIPAWADMTISQISQGTLPSSTKIAQITPGFSGNLATYAIPQIGSQKEGAYKVMDFILSEKAQQTLLDEMAAIPLIDPSTLSSPNAGLLSGLDTKSFRIVSLGTLSTDLVKRWDEEIASL